MTQGLLLLVAAAATVGFVHSILGPDHYLPFIVMSKSGQWSLKKTTEITVICGLGHVLSSLALGALGIGLGSTLTSLMGIETVRGDLAALALIAFGFGYGAWGLRQALRKKPHTHSHVHERGGAHSHMHVHCDNHAHVHGSTEKMTPWVLFTIFVLGPCEPAIPLLMAAAQISWGGLLLVTGMFGAVTIATMLTVVLLSVRGLALLPMHGLSRYMHALAGGTILLSGLAIQFLGL